MATIYDGLSFSITDNYTKKHGMRYHFNTKKSATGIERATIYIGKSKRTADALGAYIHQRNLATHKELVSAVMSFLTDNKVELD